MKMDPTFVREGEELIYTVQENDTLLSLMRLKLVDGSSERLHPAAVVPEVEATFTPDGRFYAFLQIRQKLVIRDTRQNKDVTVATVGMRRPSIAPDGSGLVFSHPANNGQQVQALNNQGQDRQTLTRSGFNSWPAFSPDGRRIAFGSSNAGKYDIHVMDADGSNVQRLTEGPGLNMRPSWSPDGRHIAFTSNRDGHYQIYIMRADGSDRRRLSNHLERDDFAAWHPDGKRLVIVSERSGKFDLYLVEVPG
jgi:Tol biopolymer transport system component